MEKIILKIIEYLKNKWVLTFTSLLILWLIGNFVFYFHENIVEYNFFYVTGILIFFIFIFNDLGKIKNANDNQESDNAVEINKTNKAEKVDNITEINEDKLFKIANIILGFSAMILYLVFSSYENELSNSMRAVLNLNTFKNLTDTFNHTHFINIYFIRYLFLFVGLFSLLTSIKSDKLPKHPETHFKYGLTQILMCVVLLSGFFALSAYTIFFLSKDFLSSKDAFEFSKWSIGAIGIGLNAFNIKLFVDYFRGAKVNAPYSLEQLQQLQILQQMQSNLEASTPSEKKLSQEKIMSEEDIKAQIKNVKTSGNL